MRDKFPNFRVGNVLESRRLRTGRRQINEELVKVRAIVDDRVRRITPNRPQVLQKLPNWYFHSECSLMRSIYLTILQSNATTQFSMWRFSGGQRKCPRPRPGWNPDGLHAIDQREANRYERSTKLPQHGNTPRRRSVAKYLNAFLAVLIRSAKHLSALF